MTNDLKRPSPSILGLGSDIIEIERIRTLLLEHEDRFMNRVFTSKERDYCRKYKDSAPHFAGRFAAKEAIVKALGTGIGEGGSWQDIEIVNDSKGKPIAQFSPRFAEHHHNPSLLVTISHSHLYALAVAILTH